ncbi:lipoprotein insertase outer membrane protein LolB [Acinetobacter sp. B51(2017)]|uniref:lipoprotein insertase outer membrane protein LolB n=1 Tax=Acinetobacter sp. B51(2017) TaxID=2060938 RepID=UPI000F08BF8B|nr:lipoprotein insertase outer membrane protein LolB [Acinetobacter sp. B51(2017)]
MLQLPHFALISSLAASLALTACQPFSQPQLKPTPQLQDSQNFSLQGKIGVRTPQQSGSAFYTWVQQHNQFEIELSGILGIGKTQISGQKHGPVSLNSNQTGLISASSPEELLKRATGWDAPITYLMDWIQAKPATQNAQISRDDQQRIRQISEVGWVVDLSYNQSQLPNRLILKQALENGQENRITMLIQDR